MSGSSWEKAPGAGPAGDDAGSSVVLHLRIRGRVQGVGYRMSMVDEARRLGVVGWVRNRSDGTVEAMLAAQRAQADALLRWAQRGPPAARVDAVEVQPGEGSFPDFRALPTQ